MACVAGACSGPPTSGTGSLHCRATFNSPSVELLAGRAGTHWAPALATPAWAQFTFPATPEGTSRLTMRYTLDSRYRPELYGGNACENASATYNCTICKFDGACAWDSGLQGSTAPATTLRTSHSRQVSTRSGPRRSGANTWSLVRTM